jgi:hypothetical protein
LYAGPTFLLGAVSQKQVYEVLIRHPKFCRHSLEISHHRRIETDGDLTLAIIAEAIGAKQAR